MFVADNYYGNKTNTEDSSHLQSSTEQFRNKYFGLTQLS